MKDIRWTDVLALLTVGLANLIDWFCPGVVVIDSRASLYWGINCTITGCWCLGILLHRRYGR